MDENINSLDVLGALNYLENHHNKLERIPNYNILLSALDREGHVDVNILERIQAVGVHDLKEDQKYTYVLLNLISAIIHKTEDGTSEPPLDLMPSALAVMNIINTSALLNKVDTYKEVCYDTLLSYPDTTLIAIVENVHMEVLTMLNLYCHIRIPLTTRIQACTFLHKLLKILPCDKKRTFIGTGISVWFSKIIPTAMAHMELDDTDHEIPMQILELLTEDLIHFNYTKDKAWTEIIECICHHGKYPLIMQSLLYDGQLIWHRLWIVFIKLLKHQITMSFGSIGSPINSMLPVVEAAFKTEVINRCKAFECWNVLIESFSTETNENNIGKRIKLLIIPLKSNNAKAEETALAKFKCWWHLITKFESKMDRFQDMILVSFLHFLYGKHSATDQAAFVPAQISLNVKKQTIKAVVELVGHVDCSGCTNLDKLTGKIISPKHLVDNWDQWVYALTSSITMAADDDVLTTQQVKCLWKSFILTIGALPDNNIRKDLFYEMLSKVKMFIKKYNKNMKLGEIAFNVLLMSLFDGDPTIRVLLKTKKGDNNPMNETLDMLQEPSLRDFYQRHERRELVTKLKHITKVVVEKNFNPTYVMARFLLELPATETALIVWTALAESIYEYERMCVKNLITMLMWPLENMHVFRDVDLAALAWYKLYNLVQPKLNMTDIEEQIMTIILFPTEFTRPVSNFTMCALLALIKWKFVDEQFTGYNKEAGLLEILTNNIVDFKSIEQLFPLLVDVLTLVIHNVTVNVNVTLASHVLICFKNVLKISMRELNDQCNDQILTSLGIILKCVDKFLNVEAYSKLGAIITDDLLQYPSILREQNSIKSDILSILNTIMQKSKDNDEALFSKIKAAIDNLDNVTTTDVIRTQEIQEKGNKSDNNKFTTPNTNELPKKLKKKEPANAVSDNGEEYFVVKSNWKFNPRKLTEHQKERLKRKREDIPALYQDLSQSQDEFQLASWRADSQDTTSSKSESSISNAPTNEDAATILKNVPSSDVVPNILDNILTKDTNYVPKDIPNKTEPVTPKNTKSPRMALKDRVFRNVRNLIEKSSLQKENKDSEDQNQCENIDKTPIAVKMDLENNKTEAIPKTPSTTKAKSTDKVMNSAPSLISADRPARVKRKPKKFDDVQLLALKRSRHTLHGTPSDVKTVQTTAEMDTSKNKDETINKVRNEADPVAKENPLDSAGDKNIIQQNDDVIDVHDSDMTDTDTNTKSNDHTINVEVTYQKALEENVDVHMKTEEILVMKCDDSRLNTDKKEANISEKIFDTRVEDNIQEISTPIQSKVKVDDRKPTAKKNGVKKSRIEKELAIDMVEGHPFLKMQSEKRLTRKNTVTPSPTSGRRKGMTEKLNKSKSDGTTPARLDKKNKNKKEIENEETSFVVNETQEMSQISKDSMPEDLCSEDVIESSQDSTFSTLSVKSAKKTNKKVPHVSIEKLNPTVFNNESNVSQSILDCGAPIEPVSPKANYDTKDDSELPLNKTAVEEKNCTDLTENMDTELINEDDISDDVIIINDNIPAPITVSSEDTVIGPETQEIAEADTQPVDPNDYINSEVADEKTSDSILMPEVIEKVNNVAATVENELVETDVEKSVITQSDITKTLSESACVELEKTDVSSPYKDDIQRNQDFLSNTLEISPIKTMSPDRCKKSPSPETSSDFVVITLTSPVHSNGEPFEICVSPECFTNDKVSPDKRDQSPPRVEVTVTNTSPSSSLSLKKNRPPVRPGGRAAQMLGLCVPDKLNAIINPERNEPEESKKCSPSNTAARRNLRILYNTVQNEHNDGPSENEDPESFLKFKRSLPAIDSSPSGPILKRKLIEITDDATISPASKRKRVSFHDPPVSTTVSVQKYIESGGIRSPQNSAQKRLERQMRQFIPVKSPKRLDNAFKLDSALTKTLESFTEVNVNNTVDDTQQSSLDETPSVEIVKAGELNDRDPVCPELLECKDPIDNIASELSSPAMKSLLIAELEGKVETVGDLAKLTELEVNRLCIKAPKVNIAKKVLSDYVAKKAQDATVAIDAAMFDETMKEAAPKSLDIETQTDCNVVSTEVQTMTAAVTSGSMQTEVVPISHSSVQTDETGEGSTADVIKSCLLKRSDFIEELSEQLQESSVQQISEKLPFSVLTDIFMKKVTPSNSDAVLYRLFEQQNADAPTEDRRNKELSLLQDFICERFDSKDLILFCSRLLQRVHDKPT